MQIKKIIKNFEDANSSLDKKIGNLKGVVTDEEKLWRAIEGTKEADFFINCKAFNFIADSLQLVDNPQRLDEFNLDDIAKMYSLLTKHYCENIQYRIDQIEFLYRVMDKEKESALLIKELIEDLDHKKEYLLTLLDEIKE